MQIICFQHVSFEGPAVIKDWAVANGHSLNCIEVIAGGTLPPTDSYDMLVVMGGPMNIYEEADYPWLAEEKVAIRNAIDAGKIVVGVCLGGQLIADTLGAPVTRGKEVEIGWLDIERSSECPDAITLPDLLRVYHWHGDTFEIPEGATRIASSEACPNQGFLYKNRVLALQCHLETTRESLDALIEACGDEIKDGRYIQGAATMRAEPDATFETMHEALFRLLDQLDYHE